MNKKGLSDIIATVLIVLLALAAIAIVWAFVRPTIEGSGQQINVAQSCFNAEAKVTGCGATINKVNVQLIKGTIGGDVGEVKSIIVVVKDSSGVTHTGTGNPVDLFSSISITPTGYTILDTDTAQAAVQVADGQGGTYTCDLSPTVVTCA